MKRSRGVLEPSESQLELQILHELVQVQGLLAWKNPTTGYFDARIKKFRKHSNPYARNGVGDVLLVIQGHLIAFEIKSATGRQSASQKAFELDLKSHGGHYYLVRSLKDVYKALEDFRRSLPTSTYH